jgi:anaerobic magnesium-protoporphyrin IX monomethyl ester cyclase
MSKPFHIILIDGSEVIKGGFIPTGLCYLSAYLKKHIDNDLIRISIITRPSMSLDSLFAMEPDLVGYTTFTHSFQQVAVQAKKWRQRFPDLLLVLGGQHISMAPWSLPREFNYGVIGEGEETFLQLVELAIQNKPLKSIEIAGTEFWSDNNLIVAPSRNQIEPLDTIPFPDREIIVDLQEMMTVSHINVFGHTKTRTIQITTSRGCPHRCRFCQPSLLWGKYRMHSAGYIANELDEAINKFGANAILIEDDLFSISKKRIQDLIEILREKKILGKAEFYIAARTSQIDSDWVQMYKELNVVKVELGIESGSDKIASYLKTGISDKKTNKKAISLLNKAGIGVYASFIIGSPPETMKDLFKTIKMIYWIQTKFRLNQCGINIATPLPGTLLWDDAVERSLIQPSPNAMDWSKVSSLQKFPKSTNDFIPLSLHIKPHILIRIAKCINVFLLVGTPTQFLYALPRRLKKRLQIKAKM